MKGMLVLVILLVLYPTYTFAAYPMTPTPEYLRYIATAQITILAASLTLLIIIYYSIVKVVAPLRKWRISAKLTRLLPLYLTLSSLLLYIVVYFFATPQIGSIISYESPAMLVYLGILIVHPFSWIGFVISIFLNKYILGKFLNTKKLLDVFMLSFLQVPIIGVLIFYVVTQIFYKLIPFTGVPYLN